MQLFFYQYELQLKHQFTLSSSSRKSTPAVMTEITHEGVTGYGEASMPPYLNENYETAIKFLSKINLSQFKDPFLTEDILEYFDSIDKGNFAVKASVDIALHDLIGKLTALPLYKMWGLNKFNAPNTSFTIGIDTPDIIKQKIDEASSFKILKIKLGSENDKKIIETIREITDVPICVDVNQGWNNKDFALDMINWLSDKNILFVEQPLPKELMKESAWLKEKSPLPIIADEAVQTSSDILKIRDLYHGINIKLMKCGGLRTAREMIYLAKELGLKVMIGCMTETSCAVSAAAQLSPLCHWADLDGNLLIKNDLFDGMKIIDGKITLNDLPGIGIEKKFIS
ncbi:MAG: dipeptide epimerase [Marinilabiliaceae bacterium]|nr:dipeptide epimerase [Marinilabiliaceae bacterium]